MAVLFSVKSEHWYNSRVNEGLENSHCDDGFTELLKIFLSSIFCIHFTNYLGAVQKNHSFSQEGFCLNITLGDIYLHAEVDIN